ncbi:uncharacterized protein LOC121071578 [Cygnus olor]|uniref:uncharacterized protein LOC121071578 n=1 Tax=Cygnus olor TaxID=8869 RepID=UPI001ADE9561|nr:uncharacterized protein LOC121071578 [Cygnus olor]
MPAPCLASASSKRPVLRGAPLWALMFRPGEPVVAEDQCSSFLQGCLQGAASLLVPSSPLLLDGEILGFWLPCWVGTVLLAQRAALDCRAPALLGVFFWNSGLLPSLSLPLLACRDVGGVEGLGVGSWVLLSGAKRELGSRKAEAANPLRKRLALRPDTALPSSPSPRYGCVPQSGWRLPGDNSVPFLNSSSFYLRCRLLSGKSHVKSLVALELQEVPPPHYTEQKDVRKNFWSVLNAVIPTDSLLLDLELEASLGAHGSHACTFVLNAALPLTEFSVCQFFIVSDAAVIVVCSDVTCDGVCRGLCRHETERFP